MNSVPSIMSDSRSNTSYDASYSEISRLIKDFQLLEEMGGYPKGHL